MYKIDNPTAVSVKPASTAAGSGGFFTDGNPAAGIPATIVPGEWLNAVQMELTDTITFASIALNKSAPFSQLSLAIQSCQLNYQQSDTGAANAYVASFKPAFATLVDGMVLTFQAAHSNTGASTLNVNGLGALPILGSAHQPLQGGEIAANGKVEVIWHSALNAFILLEQTGGAYQVSPAAQSQHAVQFGQLTGLIGSMRNASMVLPAVSSSATFNADLIIVGTALNGLQYALPSFSKTINLATVGAGGMDVGAPPVNGFVAIYAIYNPTTGATSILATDVSTIVAPTIYSAGHMPAGYTASALVSVWGTTGSQLNIGCQYDRNIQMPVTLVLSTSIAGSNTPVTMTAVPKNAKFVGGSMTTISGAAGQCSLSIMSMAAGLVGQQVINTIVTAAAIQSECAFGRLGLPTAQTFYYSTSAPAGTTFDVTISSYDF